MQQSNTIATWSSRPSLFTMGNTRSGLQEAGGPALYALCAIETISSRGLGFLRGSGGCGRSRPPPGENGQLREYPTALFFPRAPGGPGRCRRSAPGRHAQVRRRRGARSRQVFANFGRKPGNRLRRPGFGPRTTVFFPSAGGPRGAAGRRAERARSAVSPRAVLWKHAVIFVAHGPRLP
ncbi:hypothetical protein LCGC14_1517760 [marine sediment metagenome]|uniref:Uncharacterized protein n=1 Tax=marine sediment metagenome TaxID=412755 RepID=A0A0F9IZK6_9ZZZZ